MLSCPMLGCLPVEKWSARLKAAICQLSKRPQSALGGLAALLQHPLQCNIAVADSAMKREHGTLVSKGFLSTPDAQGVATGDHGSET